MVGGSKQLWGGKDVLWVLWLKLNTQCSNKKICWQSPGEVGELFGELPDTGNICFLSDRLPFLQSVSLAYPRLSALVWLWSLKGDLLLHPRSSYLRKMCDLTLSHCVCVYSGVCRCLNLSAHLKFSLSMRTACYRCLRLLPGRLPRFLSRCGLTDGDGGETSHWCLMILKRRYLLFHFLSLWVSVQEKKKSEFGKQVVSDFLLKGNRDVCGVFYCFGKCFLNFIFPTRKSHLQHYYAVWEREEE